MRFAGGQPPSRQSRYGNDEDSDISKYKDKALLKGSSISAGYRRRQVNRLMSLQQVRVTDSRVFSACVVANVRGRV